MVLLCTMGYVQRATYQRIRTENAEREGLNRTYDVIRNENLQLTVKKINIVSVNLNLIEDIVSLI